MPNFNLLFPQWQGSGPSNVLYHSAVEMAGICPEFNFVPVPVPEIDPLEMTQGILGYQSVLEQMQMAAGLVKQAAPGFIVTLGGDCGIECAPVSYLNQKHGGNFTLVWLDAHADLNTPDTSPSGHFHGMPLATLMGLGDPTLCRNCFSSLEPDQIILAGIRALDPAESELIRSLGITRVPVRKMEEDLSALGRAIIQKGNRPVYIHIDLDVLDPHAFPYVKHPEQDGLKPETLAKMLDEIKRISEVVGLGVMEFTLSPFSAPTGNVPAMDTRGLKFVKSLMEKFRQPN